MLKKVKNFESFSETKKEHLKKHKHKNKAVKTSAVLCPAQGLKHMASRFFFYFYFANNLSGFPKADKVGRGFANRRKTLETTYVGETD